MTEFAHFEQMAPADEATMARYARLPGFPAELVDVWRRHGYGFVDPDGVVRIVDPDHYTPDLANWFDSTEDAVVFATTGLGDLFLLRDGIVTWVVYRTGHLVDLGVTVPQLLGELEKDVFLDSYLWRQRYLEGVRRLGRPDLYEAFYYAPFQVLGGPDRAENLDRGDLGVSLSLFTQMCGRADLLNAEPLR